jgi:hypothetical protein
LLRVRGSLFRSEAEQVFGHAVIKPFSSANVAMGPGVAAAGAAVDAAFLAV